MITVNNETGITDIMVSVPCTIDDTFPTDNNVKYEFKNFIDPVFSETTGFIFVGDDGCELAMNTNNAIQSNTAIGLVCYTDSGSTVIGIAQGQKWYFAHKSPPLSDPKYKLNKFYSMCVYSIMESTENLYFYLIKTDKESSQKLYYPLFGFKYSTFNRNHQGEYLVVYIRKNTVNSLNWNTTLKQEDFELIS